MNRIAWKQLGCIVLLALAARLGAAALWHERMGGRFALGDSNTYWHLGRTIARGEEYLFPAEGYDARVFRSPGYPILLAPLFVVGSGEAPVFWGRVQGAVFGSLAVAGVWWLARQFFRSRAALFAGLAGAVYPGAVATSVTVLTESPFSALMMAQFCAWVAAWRSISRRGALVWGAGAGAIAGAAVLVRPSWLLFTPGVVALLWLVRWRANRTVHGDCPRRPQGDRHIFQAETGRKMSQSAGRAHANETAGRRHEPAVGLAVLVAMLAVMTPWWVRNAQVTGHFVPTTLQVGASLYDGLNPQATGASNMAFVPAFVEAERERAPDGDDPFEWRLDRRMRREALRWACAHPGRVAYLALVKMGRTWNLWPNEPRLSGWLIRIVVAGTYGPLLCLAVLGAWRTIRSGWPYVLCCLPAVYFTLLHTVFVGSIRYREPAMLPLIVLAAGAVFHRECASPRQEETQTIGEAC